MSAFNSQLTKEEAPLESISESTPQQSDGSLSSQLVAAIKKRKSSKQEQSSEKDSRSSFKKRWSLKRKSRDKGKESVSTEEQLETEQVAGPGEGSERLPSTNESTGGLQGNDTCTNQVCKRGWVSNFYLKCLHTCTCMIHVLLDVVFGLVLYKLNHQ